MMFVCYFGFRPEYPGHNLYINRSNDRPVTRTERRFLHLPFEHTTLDGHFLTGVPDVPEMQGAAVLSYFDYEHAWSMISFWDRSGDARTGSNSSFLIDRPRLSFETICDHARRCYPTVWARFPFSIRQLVTNHAGQT